MEESKIEISATGDQSHYGELIARREEELRRIKDSQMESLRSLQLRQQQTIKRQKEEISKITEDYKFNLSLLAERDSALLEYESAFQRMKDMVTERDAIVAKYKDEITELKSVSQIQKMESGQLEKFYKGKLQAFSDQLESRNAAHEVALEDQKVKFEESIRVLQSKLRSKNEEFEIIEQRVKTQLEQDLHKFYAENETKLENEHHKVRTLRASKTNLQKQLERLAERHCILEEKAKFLMSQIDGKNKELAKVQEDLKSSTAKAGTAIMEEKQKSREAVQSLEARMKDIVSEKLKIAREREIESTKLRTELQHVRQRNIEYEKEVENLKKLAYRATAAEVELAGWRKDYKEHSIAQTQEMENIKAKHAREIHELQRTVWEKEQKLAKVNATMKGLQNRMSMTGGDVVRLREGKVKAEARMTELQSQLIEEKCSQKRSEEELRAQIQLLEGKLKVSITREKASLERIKTLHDSNIQQDSKISKICKDMDDLRLESKNLKNELVQEKSKFTDLEEQTKTRVALLEAQKSRAEKNEKELKSKLDEAKLEIESNKNENLKLQEDKRELLARIPAATTKTRKQSFSVLSPKPQLTNEITSPGRRKHRFSFSEESLEEKKMGNRSKPSKFNVDANLVAGHGNSQQFAGHGNSQQLELPSPSLSDDLGPPPSPLPEIPAFSPDPSPTQGISNYNFGSRGASLPRYSISTRNSNISTKIQSPGGGDPKMLTQPQRGNSVASEILTDRQPETITPGVDFKNQFFNLQTENSRLKAIVKEMRAEMEKIRQFQLQQNTQGTPNKALGDASTSLGTKQRLSIEETKNQELEVKISQLQRRIKKLKSEREKLIDISNMLKARIHRLQSTQHNVAMPVLSAIVHGPQHQHQHHHQHSHPLPRHNTLHGLHKPSVPELPIAKLSEEDRSMSIPSVIPPATTHANDSQFYDHGINTKRPKMTEIPHHQIPPSQHVEELRPDLRKLEKSKSRRMKHESDVVQTKAHTLKKTRNHSSIERLTKNKKNEKKQNLRKQVQEMVAKRLGIQIEGSSMLKKK